MMKKVFEKPVAEIYDLLSDEIMGTEKVLSADNMKFNEITPPAAHSDNGDF